MSAMSRLAPARVPLALARILLVSLLVTGCASSQAVPRPFPGAALPPAAGEPPAAVGSAPAAVVATAPEPPAPITTPEDGSSAGVRPAWTSELLASALALRGTPYRNGGTDPNSPPESVLAIAPVSGSGQEGRADRLLPLPLQVRVSRDDVPAAGLRRATSFRRKTRVSAIARTCLQKLTGRERQKVRRASPSLCTT